MGTFYPATNTYVTDYGASRINGLSDYHKAVQKAADAEEARIQQAQQQSNQNLLAAAQAQADAVTEAARIKAAAADKSLQWQKDQYAQSQQGIKEAVSTAREDLNPWRQAGEDALGNLVEMINAGPGDYTKSPGYEARLAEGQKAIERSAAARGNVLSGASVKAATRFGQEYATQDYDNFLKRYYDSLAPYQQLSGVGANAAQAQGGYSVSGANALAGAGQNSVNSMANTAIYGGESTAGGITNSSNILAAYQQALAEQQTAYNAFKQGQNY